MGWRDKYKRRRRDEAPAMVDVQRLKNSIVEFSQTDRNKTLVRAEELNATDVRQNHIKQGAPQEPASGRALFRLAPGAKRITLHGVRFKGSGFDSLVSGTDAEYLAVSGCSMEAGGPAPRREPRRYIFPPPSVPPVPAREEERRSGKHIGRNEQCPCGSGKRYKHCHGRLTPPGAPAAS